MNVGFIKLGPTEIILIFVVVLLIFGPSKLPQVGKSIGKGIREFRKASKDITDGLDETEDASEETKN